MLFVTQYAELAALRRRLRKTGTDRTGWISEYVDTASGEKWIDVYQDVDGRMPPILRKANLPSNLGQLVDEALSSPREDDWYGLAFYFNQDGVDADELLVLLSSNCNKWSDRALRTFGKALEIPDVRRIIGMTVDEVGASYQRFVQLKKNINELIHRA